MKMRMTYEFIAESRKRRYHGAEMWKGKQEARQRFKVQFVYTFPFAIAKMEIEQLPNLTSSFPLTDHFFECEVIQTPPSVRKLAPS